MESTLRLSKDTIKDGIYQTNKPSFKNDIIIYVELLNLTSIIKNVDITINHQMENKHDYKLFPNSSLSFLYITV